MKRKLLSMVAGMAMFFPVTGQLISEDFSMASGSTAPLGWTNSDLNSSGEVWQFSNPGSRTLNSPISSPAAIFDSDNYSFGPAEDAALVSPAFDASGATNLYLSFDHYFKSGSGGAFAVEVFDGSTWDTVLQSSGVSTANPKSELIDITAAANGSVAAQVRFHWTGDWSWYWIVDNVVVQSLTCAAPTALGAYNITQTTADIYWTAGGASNWNLEYGPAGFTPGSGTMQNVTNDTVSLSGLSHTSSYEFYVRDSCGVGDVSNWSGPYSFVTLCGNQTIPYLQDFSSIIPTCWDEADAGNPTSGPTSLGSGSWTSGTLANGSNSSYEINLYAASKNDWVISPTFDLSGGPFQLEMDLAIMAFGSSSTVGSLGSDDEVQLLITTDGGTTWTALHTWNNSSVTSVGGDHYIFNLSSYAGSTAQFAVWATEGTVNDPEDIDVSFDNFEIGLVPSCAAPTALGAYNITQTTADIYWTGGGATDWNIEYGVAGFTPGSGIMQNETNDTVSLSGLSHTTVYEFYVRDSCGVADVSSWSGPYTFTTLCGTPALPYLEDFSTLPPSCWSVADLGDPQSGPGAIGSSSWSSGTFANGSDASYEINLYSDTKSDWLISPEFDLSGGPFILEFDLAIMEWNSSSNAGTLGSDDTVQVLITTDGGTSWTALQTWNNASVNSVGGDHFSFNLSAYAGSNAQFAFWATEGSTDDLADNDVSIDNFEISSLPTCPDPSQLGAKDISTSTASLYWSSGGASNWDVEYGNIGFSLGSGTTVNATNDTVTIIMLTANTQYEFYVRDSCGVGNSSAWVGPFSFRTMANPLALPYYNDFETSIVDFYNDPANTDDWLIDTAKSSGSSSVKNAHSNSAVNMLILPNPIDLSTYPNAILTFDQIAKLEGTYDLGFVEYSADSGASWQPIPASNYLGASNDYATNEYFHEDSYSDWGTTNTTPTNGWWKPEVFNLSGLSSGWVMLRFKLDADSYVQRKGWYIDNLTIVNPSCAQPTALGVDSISHNSARLYWTGGGAADFNVVVDTAGFAPGNGSIQNSSNDTLYLTNLNASTSYHFYVRDSCGTNDVSAWSGPFSFTTLCAPVVAPFSEDFETSGTSQPNCWQNFSTTGEEWKFRSSNLGHSASTGANGSTYFAAFDDSESPSTSDGTLETPMIDVSTLTNPELAFYLWSDAEDSSGVSAGGEPNATITVSVYDGAAWNQVYTNTGNTNGWAEVLIDLSTLTISGPIKVRFVVDEDHDGGFDDDISIDEIEVREMVTCTDPTALAVSAIGLNSVHLSWTSGGASDVEIEYGPVGFAVGSGTRVSGLGSSQTVNGLSALTCYDAYLRDSCGSGNVSAWVGPVTFCTQAQCAPATAPLVANDTVCGAGDVNFATTGSADDYIWFNAGNDTIIASGNSFTDSIAVNTDYEVAAVSKNGMSMHIGPDISISSNVYPGSNFSNGQYITVYDTLRIDSTTLMINGAAQGYVAILDSADGTVLQSSKLWSTSGADTVQVEVGLVLTPGSYYMRSYVVAGSGVLYRSTSGASYPYGVSGLLTVDSVNFTNQTRYYYFYDMVVSSACISSKATVSGIVDTGAYAGMSVTDTVCDTLSAVDLSNYLDPAAMLGGNFVDVSATGALSGNLFDATMVTNGASYDFAYVVSSSSQCPADTAIITLHVNDCGIGLKEYPIGMQVYPTLVDNVVYVEGTNLLKSSYRVALTALNGAVVYRGDYSASERAVIDVSRLAPGVYTLRIESDGKMETHRIIKQ